MANCTPTLVINKNGKEETFTGNKINENASFLEIITNIANKNEGEILSWSDSNIAPLDITSLIQITYVLGNTNANELLSRINWLSRDYNPIVNNIKELLEKIEALGMPKILWINGDIKLNGTSIPTININQDLGDDLIVLKGNNTSEIYKTLLEYFYEKIIKLDKSKLTILGKRLLNLKDLFINTSKNKGLVEEISKISILPNTVLPLILHNQIIGNMLDLMPGNGFNTAREEIFFIMQELTLDYKSARIKPNSKYLNYDPTSENLEDHVIEVTDGEGVFKLRTIENANWADITIALAENFNTAGENLTLRAAKDTYVNSDIDLNNPQEAINRIYAQLVNKGKTENLKLNIAGNGIYTLSENLDKYDAYLVAIIQGLQEKGVTIKEIRSGGQTGIDEAGIKAAITLGLPWSILAPKNYTYINKENKHLKGIENFLKRFDPNFLLKQKIIQFPVNGTLVQIDANLQNAFLNIYEYLYSNNAKVQSIKMPETRNHATMTMNYGTDKRNDVKSANTFNAIINGERTSTTRQSDWAGFDLWKKLQQIKLKYPNINIIVDFRNTKENKDDSQHVYVTVKSITQITKEMSEDPNFIELWSKAEGWSKLHFLKKIKPEIDKGKEVLWVQYDLTDPRYTLEMKEIASLAQHLARRIANGEKSEMLVKEINEFINLC